MADETEGERRLAERWPDAKDLEDEFSYMGESIKSRGFETTNMGKPKFNVYENGRVVSRTLIQSPAGKNPTVGVILPGAYAFPTGSNTETLTVLQGELEASVDTGPVSRLQRDGTIVAPSGTVLGLTVRKDWAPCFYICRYTPRENNP
jgi:uncharacterized protein YaiE (UPF0345 family)